MKKSLLLFVSILSLMACTKKTGDTGTNVPQPKGVSHPITQTSNATEILVGGVLSLSGGQASFGTSTRDGIELAIKQINAAGGVLGKKYRLIALDDQSKPEEAAIIMTRLITQDKVTAVLGEIASSISLAMAPIAQSHKIPMITPSSTNPKVTQVGDYIFRTCFIDPFQGTVMAKFAFNTLGVKKVAVLRDIKNDYSVGLANFFIKTYKELGGEILIDESYSEGDVDFRSQLTSIKGKKPEAVFVPGYYTEAGLITRQAREMGLNVPLMGGDGWDSEKLIEIGGASIKDTYFSNHYSADDPSPQGQKFLTAFQAEYKHIPDGMAVTGYDAMMVLDDAVRRAGSDNPTAIRDALAQTKDFPGASGVISMNASRDAVKAAVVLEYKENKYVFMEKVEP